MRQNPLIRARSFFFLIGLLLLTSAAEADPLTIPAGFDLLESPPDGTPGPGGPAVGSVLELVGIPAGFFGTVGSIPSDPIVNSILVPIEGHDLPRSADPLVQATGDSDFLVPESAYWKKNGLTAHCFWRLSSAVPSSPRGTVVERKFEIVLGNIGDTATVPVEIVALSLRSSQPIEVTYGGTNPQFFDVFVELDPNATPSTGLMTLMRTSERGGTFEGTVPLPWRMTFVNTDPTGPQAMGPLTGSFDMFGNNAHWELAPAAVPSLYIWSAILLTLVLSVLVVRFTRRSWEARSQPA